MTKKLLALLLVFTFGTVLWVSPVQAQSVCETGFCMVDNQLCPGGQIRTDSSCNTGAYNGTACCVSNSGSTDDPNDAIKPVEAPTNETFDALNPLQIAGGDSIDDNAPSEFADDLSTPGGIISRLLVFIFPLAGLILFLMITWGGFEIITGAGDSNKVTAGKQRATAAIVGFLILFASYWMVQIMEVVFGVVIF